MPIVLDVTDEASVTDAAHAAHDVSIVVNNNAGIALGTPVLEAPIDRIRDELETNLFGTIRVTRAFAPVLAAQPRSALVGRAGGRGSSLSPTRRRPWINVLSVLSSLSMGTGYDVLGTTVTALHVAFMDTEMTAAIQAPNADPRDIARQAADAIASGAPEVLADETTRTVKSKLSEDLSALYAA